MSDLSFTELQSLTLEAKVAETKRIITEWYTAARSMVYVSFSGGVDSTVLLHLVRELYPDTPAMFIDTGLEYPEIREFVKSHNNVDWVKPKESFKYVIQRYGYPVVSKEQAALIYTYRNTSSEKTRHRCLHGNKRGYFGINKKWIFLIDAPFKISAHCCSILKVYPAKYYQRDTTRVPFLGVKATDSILRRSWYKKYGCNGYDMVSPKSNPISFWTDQDVLRYMKDHNLQYCSVYGDLVEEGGLLKTTGADRTGCMFCMFGLHMDSRPNRFERMKLTHPKLYNYCIYELGLKDVLDFMKQPY